MGMKAGKSGAFADACSALVGQIAANKALSDAVVHALESGELNTTSGPVSISHVMKGHSGAQGLRKFLQMWTESASHLDAEDVTAAVKAALASYHLAQDRAHFVDAVWTGPDVVGSEVRRTEAVVHEIVASAESDLLVVGYWLVSSTEKVADLLNLLIAKAQDNVTVRFVFDPGEKGSGQDNFDSLAARWPEDLAGAPRRVFTWSEALEKAVTKGGYHYDRKLHAKVIVADGEDALVTSANLTQAGLIENLEMGLRIQGVMAGAIVRHFDRLIETGILERRE
jgi:phosphatidylserine/phosphatidylglycerophosphate/cardiolipin synthase-like enzyme